MWLDGLPLGRERFDFVDRPLTDGRVGFLQGLGRDPGEGVVVSPGGRRRWVMIFGVYATSEYGARVIYTIFEIRVNSV